MGRGRGNSGTVRWYSSSRLDRNVCGPGRVLSASDFRSLPQNSVDLRNSTDSAPNSVILPNIHRLYPFVVHKYVTFGL